jgi:hypothetical protein
MRGTQVIEIFMNPTLAEGHSNNFYNRYPDGYNDEANYIL